MRFWDRSDWLGHSCMFLFLGTCVETVLWSLIIVGIIKYYGESRKLSDYYFSDYYFGESSLWLTISITTLQDCLHKGSRLTRWVKRFIVKSIHIFTLKSLQLFLTNSYPLTKLSANLFFHNSMVETISMLFVLIYRWYFAFMALLRLSIKKYNAQTCNAHWLEGWLE